MNAGNLATLTAGVRTRQSAALWAHYSLNYLHNYFSATGALVTVVVFYIYIFFLHKLEL